jgi:hypothetical protein
VELYQVLLSAIPGGAYQQLRENNHQLPIYFHFILFPNDMFIRATMGSWSSLNLLDLKKHWPVKLEDWLYVMIKE